MLMMALLQADARDAGLAGLLKGPWADALRRLLKGPRADAHDAGLAALRLMLMMLAWLGGLLKGLRADADDGLAWLGGGC